MANRLDWNGPAAMDYVRSVATADISRVVRAISAKAQDLVSVPGPSPSRPGEPPHLQTRRLRAGIFYEVDPRAMTWRVGTTAPEGLWMELGTSRGIAPRPWLRPALADVLSRIDSLLARPGGR